MIKLCFSTVLAAIVSGALAMPGLAETAKKKHATPEKAATKTTPESPDPATMQKWFSGAVGDILTSTGRVLKDIPGSEH